MSKVQFLYLIRCSIAMNQRGSGIFFIHMNQSVRAFISPRIVNSVSKTQVSSTKNPEFGSWSLAKATSCLEPHPESENLRQPARKTKTKLIKEYWVLSEFAETNLHRLFVDHVYIASPLDWRWWLSSLFWFLARRMYSTTSLVLAGRVETSNTKNNDTLLPFPSPIPFGYKRSFLR